ncbi:hypothetical protein CTEN210_12456 [Chaetoceros tenuissimus]|uniref:Uncharacterized protein n=1 Tax=Chaetoceros tenuissimus TaxID=426638 RepID=A0AAD3D3F1_9STRA|nr:hypothetical protein CTEN210_12456 [Chaetoceros tenuissimus]
MQTKIPSCSGRTKTAVALLWFCCLSFQEMVAAFTLTTTSRVQGISQTDLYDFIATPTNWPKIVASSNSVKKPTDQINPVDQPLNIGDEVEEIFGLPPLLPLSVKWKCVSKDRDESLLFYSQDGVPYFAKDCWMKFYFDSNEEKDDSVEVKLVMEFDTLNPLVMAATPILNADNNLALKVLLPLALSKR